MVESHDIPFVNSVWEYKNVFYGTSRSHIFFSNEKAISIN